MSLQEHIHKTRTLHVIQRARERYETILTPEDVKYIEFRVFYTSCPLVRPLCSLKDGFLYAVRVKGEWMAFIFDRVTRQAITIYPKERLGPYRKALDQVKSQFKKDYADKKDHPLWSEMKKPYIDRGSPPTPHQIWKDQVS